MNGFNLAGKRAMITGASSGLGRHFALTLSAAGAEVVLAARRLDIIVELADRIRTGGGIATTVRLDVTERCSIENGLAQAGTLDILINNAGVTSTKPVLEQTEADFDGIIGTNLKGGYLVAIAAAKLMAARGSGGSIINIASILGLRQGGQVTPYAISKAGVIQMTKQLGLELARYNIRVNALAPGYVATELNDEFFQSEAGRALIKRIPQRRLGQLADLDGPLLLLASDASRYMSGAVIAVDGGHLLSSL